MPCWWYYVLRLVVTECEQCCFTLDDMGRSGLSKTTVDQNIPRQCQGRFPTQQYFSLNNLHQDTLVTTLLRFHGVCQCLSVASNTLEHDQYVTQFKLWKQLIRQPLAVLVTGTQYGEDKPSCQCHLSLHGSSCQSQPAGQRM